eukprot:5762952-Pyramimonas_sp.AAC.1
MFVAAKCSSHSQFRRRTLAKVDCLQMIWADIWQTFPRDSDVARVARGPRCPDGDVSQMFETWHFILNRKEPQLLCFVYSNTFAPFSAGPPGRVGPSAGAHPKIGISGDPLFQELGAPH